MRRGGPRRRARPARAARRRPASRCHVAADGRRMADLRRADGACRLASAGTQSANGASFDLGVRDPRADVQDRRDRIVLPGAQLGEATDCNDRVGAAMTAVELDHQVGAAGEHRRSRGVDPVQQVPRRESRDDNAHVAATLHFVKVGCGHRDDSYTTRMSSRPGSGGGSCGSIFSNVVQQDLGHGQVAHPVAVGGHDVPRRMARSRSCGSRPGTPPGTSATACGRRDRRRGTSSASRVVDALLQPLALLVLGHVEEALHHGGAFVGEQPLEVVDVVEPLAPHPCGAKSFTRTTSTSS